MERYFKVMNDVEQRWSVDCEKQRSLDKALKLNWSGWVVAKFHILDSIRKVRLYPRECKAINSKVRLKSLQQYLVVDSIKCNQEAMRVQLPLSHMSERLLKMCESSFFRKTVSVGRSERRDVRGCDNMGMNSGQNESFRHFWHGRNIGDSNWQESLGQDLAFLRRGRTWVLLKIEGKMPVLKKRFASLERIRDRISVYFLSKWVGRESREDDLLGSEWMSLRTSSEDRGWRTEIGTWELPGREGRDGWWGKGVGN